MKKSVRSLSKSRTRIERPYLFIDPYGDGVCIVLPPQEFPSDVEFAQLMWHIEENENQADVATERQRTENGYEFTVSELFPVAVSSQYHVTLKSENGEISTWTLEGLSEEPIFFFDPGSGELVRKQAWHQPGEKWIVYPNEYQLLVGGGQKTSALPQQNGTWGKFTLEEWVLEPGSSLKLKSPTGEIYSYEIDENLALRRPYLDGGTKPLNQSFRSDLPLFSGQPPILVIPIGQTPDELQLTRWRLSIKPDDKARPNQPCSYLLSELQNWIITDNNNQVFLDLSSAKLFGTKPCGKFEIDIQGPLGRSRRFRVRLVPNLEVKGNHNLYLSKDDGDAVMQFTCKNDATIECVQNEGVTLEYIQNNDSHTEYKTTIAAHIPIGKYVYIDPENIQVPFFIKARRLRWGLWQRTSPKDFSWTTSTQRLFPQALPNISETELFVDLPALVDDACLYAGWRLIDPQNQIILERIPDQTKNRQQITIPLAEIMPSCRQAQINGITLNLQVWILEMGLETKEYFVDMIHLLPTLDLGLNETEWSVNASHIHISLSWESQQTSPYLKLLAWPLDQPWQREPLILDVPQTSDGFCEWDIPSADIAILQNYGGDLLGEMIIMDPWATEIPDYPLQTKANTLSLIPQSANQYYTDLEEKYIYQQASPEETLTLLSFYYRHQHFDGMYEVNKSLSQYAKGGQLNINHLILWADLIKDTGQKPAYKIVQWTLFDGSLLRRIETEWMDHPLLPQYLAHLSNNLLNLAAYKQFLLAGFSEVRQTCIKGLCRFGHPLGFDELLKDVELGEILLSEAASMLSANKSNGVNHLLHMGTQDAIDILHILSQTGDIEITWLEPGFHLSTDIGQLKIGKIEMSEDGHFIPKVSCLLTDTRRVPVVLTNEYESLPAILMLPEKTVCFQQETLYQCADCGIIFDTHPNLERHHDIAHPLTSPAFRRVKSREIKLKKITVHLPDGEKIK